MKYKFRMRDKPKKPSQMKDVYRSMTIEDGDSIEEILARNVPITARISHSKYSYECEGCDGVSVEWRADETNEEFAIRVKDYNEEMIEYKQWVADHKQEIAEYQEKAAQEKRQHEIKTFQEKQKAAKLEKKRLEKQLIDITAKLKTL